MDLLGVDLKTSSVGQNVTGYAHQHQIPVFQIFTMNPRAANTKGKKEEILKEIAAGLEKHDQIMCIHSNLMINLCNPPGNKNYKMSRGLLILDLNASAIIGKKCLGVVVHMGKNIKANNMTDEEAIETYIKNVEDVLHQTDPSTTLILETGASQGSEVGSSMTVLGQIYHSIDEKLRKRVKICIDTCHIWATGYDIGSRTKVDKFFRLFDQKIGIENIACFHYNDSKTGLASQVDRHDDIGYGMIPEEGLKRIFQFAVKHRIPMVMETPFSNLDPMTTERITFQSQREMILGWLEKPKKKHK